MNEEMEQLPRWLLRGGRINEVAFCEDYRKEHPMVFMNGAFFGVEGRISNLDTLRQEIYRVISEYVSCGLSAKVESILNTMRYDYQQDCLKERIGDIYVIPVANGTYRLDMGFSPVKHLTRYRLPVAYNPDAPKPETWLSFLDELLEPEDIPTLQEYMGYCLIPSTLGQKMLIITGSGGEGKSRIGVVMKALLGCNMNLSSIAKVENSPFARADLEHLLLMVDDDLKMEGLNQTNYIKSIITAELPMDLERKGIQSYQGNLNVRFMAFGNASLKALHDRSHGFFRRQIILTTKERPKDRVNNPYLGHWLQQEAEGILLWCIEGLERLILNQFQFTISPRAQENKRQAVLQANNVVGFFSSEGYLTFDPEGQVTSRQLYEVYKDWCQDNTLSPLASSSFLSQVPQEINGHVLTPSKSIPAGNGKYVRGFRGLRLCSRF